MDYLKRGGLQCHEISLGGMRYASTETKISTILPTSAGHWPGSAHLHPPNHGVMALQYPSAAGTDAEGGDKVMNNDIGLQCFVIPTYF